LRDEKIEGLVGKCQTLQVLAATAFEHSAFGDPRQVVR
jgi:hypothetical protein